MSQTTALHYRRGVDKNDSCQHNSGVHEHDHSSHAGHGHHHHGPKDGSDRSFAIAFFTNLIFAMIEVVGGILTNSLAITADAIHDLGDALSIGLAWGLERFSKKKSDQSFNFGYRRFSLFAALISGVIISVGAIAIGWTSVVRFSEPRTPVTWAMGLLAVLGMVVNGAGAYMMSRGAKTQSEKMITWHLLEDVLGWAIVLVGSVAMWLTGWTWIDPLLAIFLSLFILWNVGKNLKETIYLLLQGRPSNFREQDFSREVIDLPGIAHADSIRVWSLDGHQSVMSLRVHMHSLNDHVVIEQLKSKIREIASQYGVRQSNVTIETCLVHEACHEIDGTPKVDLNKSSTGLG